MQIREQWFESGRLMPALSTRRTAAWKQWVLLSVLASVTVGALVLLHLPAAFLLGPMIAGIAVSCGGGTIRGPDTLFRMAQSIVGCLMAQSIPPTFLDEVMRDWPIFIAGVTSTIISSTLLGALLMRTRLLPGTTAIWGSSPGAATAAIVLADNFGADARLVAFMQYVRVITVAMVASIASHFLKDPSKPPFPIEAAGTPVWLWASFAGTLAVACLGAFAAPRLRIPAGPLLVPLLVGATLQATGLLTIELPNWLLQLSYLLVGCTIGLRFTRPILRHALGVAPIVFASVLVLMAICGVFAAGLVHFAGIDPLTAILATSPGGADSIAIIAASSDVNRPFVMAMQSARFVVVIITAPILGRLLLRMFADQVVDTRKADL